MNIDPILDDIQQLIDDAPTVQRTEWCRQAIRRLEAAHLLIRLQAETIEALKNKEPA